MRQVRRSVLCLSIAAALFICAVAVDAYSSSLQSQATTLWNQAEAFEPRSEENAQGSFYDRLPEAGKAKMREYWKLDEQARDLWYATGWLYGFGLLFAALAVPLIAREQLHGRIRSALPVSAGLLLVTCALAWLMDQEIALEGGGILLGIVAVITTLAIHLRTTDRTVNPLRHNATSPARPGWRYQAQRLVLSLLLTIPVAVVVAWVSMIVASAGQGTGLLPSPPSPAEMPHECDLGFLYYLAFLVVAVIPVAISTSFAAVYVARFRTVAVALGSAATVLVLPGVLIWMTWDYQASGC